MAKRIVANWKMNGSQMLLDEFVPALLQGLPDSFVKNGGQTVICPPFPYLSALNDLLQGTDVQLGAQNVYPAPNGAYTGEVSPLMLAEMGCTHCVIGHSERRQYFAETDAFIQKKLLSLLEKNIVGILCVGETLEEREAGQQEAVVSRQVKAALADFPPTQVSHLVVAYEPVWAIGTGKTATPQQANDMHVVIRRLLEGALGPQAARKVDILYGGSVNAANAQILLGQPEVDGALVGGASLKVKEFLTIIEAAC